MTVTRVPRAARIAAASALALGLLLVPLASPGAAHDQVDGHGALIVSPGGDVSAVPTLSGSIRAGEVLGLKTETINTISLALKPVGPTGGEAVAADGCEFVTEGGCKAGSVSFSWTPAAPAYNGPYEFSADASHCTVVCVLPSTARFSPAPFRLGIAPKAPADLQVSSGANRSVSVSWARNAEPDLLYYAVFRKAPGAAEFTRVGGDVRQPASGRVSFTDTATPDGGDYAYKILAVRKGVTGDDKSTKTSPASVERSATVEAPAPPTTLTQTPGPGNTPPPTQAVAGSGVSISGFLSAQPAPKPAPGPKYLDLPDTGFGETLPFGEIPEELEEGDLEAVLPESGPVDESLDDSEEVSLTRPLVPVAAGAILLVLAGHIRLLNRRVRQVGPVTLSDGTLFPPQPVKPVKSRAASRAAVAPVPESPAAGDAVFAPDPEAAPAASAAAAEPNWVDFEPPAIVDSAAGGGSLASTEPIGYYVQASAPYYEEGLAGYGDEEASIPDSAAPDLPAVEVGEPVMFADDPESFEPDPFADDTPDPGPVAGSPVPEEALVDDDDEWEEEMIWEVVSPGR